MEKTDKRFREVKNYRLRNTSLLHQFDILRDDEGNLILNLWKEYTIPDDIKDNEDYVNFSDVSEDSWWDQIAYDEYANDKLWWVVALTNDVVNPFEELIPGNRVKILDDSFLYQITKSVKNISEL